MKELNIQVKEIRQRILNEEHLDTLINMNDFAFILKNKDEKAKIIAFMKECVEKWKQVLNYDHSFTKKSKDTLNRWHIENLHLSSLNKNVNNTTTKK